MKGRALFAVFAVLLIAALACDLPGSSETEVPVDDAIATAVAATQTAMAAQPDVQTEVPVEPTEEATQEQPPACQPTHPGPQVLPLPSGFAASQTGSQLAEFYDSNGVLAGGKAVTGLSWEEPGQVHLIGHSAGGWNNISIAYHSLQNNGTLMLSDNSGVSILGLSPDLIVLTGAAGESALAYSSLNWSTWISSLFAADAGVIAGSSAVAVSAGDSGWVIYPLAVHYDAGEALGVWYTYSMYGIGNIIFEPYRGLYYYDLTANTTVEFLSFDNVLAGFSPDQTMVAFAPAPDIPAAENGFTVRNLVTCQESFFALHPSSNLGGGYVKFSPDNQLLAWLEAGGPSNMEAQMRVRVARLDGTSIIDAPATSLTGLVGGEVPTWFSYAGWLQNHVFLLGANVAGIDARLLVMWAPDPTQPLDPALGANQSILAGDGNFLGFVYP